MKCMHCIHSLDHTEQLCDLRCHHGESLLVENSAVSAVVGGGGREGCRRDKMHASHCMH